MCSAASILPWKLLLSCMLQSQGSPSKQSLIVFKVCCGIVVTITFPIEWTTACTVLISKETSQNRLIVHTCFVHQRWWLMHSCQNSWHWFVGYYIWMTTSCTNIPYLEQPGIVTFICLLVVVSWMDSYTYLSPFQPPFWLWFHLGSFSLVFKLLYLCLLVFWKRILYGTNVLSLAVILTSL